MLDVFMDSVKKLLKSRLFPISIIFLALLSIIVYRLFVLQIVQGTTHAEEFEYKQTKQREIKSTRGNIYDRNGVLLASNMLSYSVTMVDSDEIKSNEQRNEIIHNLIKIIEANGDSIYSDFYIISTGEDEFEFNISGPALLRFKKKVYELVNESGELTEAQKNSSAKDIYEFLRKGTGNNYTKMFDISDDYSVAETLKIMNVRYALYCNYPKFLQITIASAICDKTVAAVLENSSRLPGVEIKQETHRVYHDSLYFAHILGYTGKISAEELDALDDTTKYYNSSDVIGKNGLEKEYEAYLGGKKGIETISVNMYGKVTDILERKDPVAGNDIYLTIDAELQKATYHILERRIAGILIDKLQPDLNYGTKGESASKILLPVYEVYFALINNNVIDISVFNDNDATATEKQVYQKYSSDLNQVFSQLDELLSLDNTITNDKAGEMEEFLDYFYDVIEDKGILLKDSIPEDDEKLKAYLNDKLPLSTFLQYALTKNYINQETLQVELEYNTMEELYQKLIDYTKEILIKDSTFNKKIYRNLVFSYKLSGTEICLLLFDQRVLEYNEEDIYKLQNNELSPYNFIKSKMESLEITPAMLALEPCSGSVVITDVKTGDVLVMVTYPSYDNNKLANKVDSSYYAKLLDDKATPLNNRPLTQRMAPGSTFKMVTSVAALEEGVITPEDEIRDLGIFDKVALPAKCHIYPRSHGSVDIVNAIKVSCNYFFYEIGYRLSLDNNNEYSEQLGLDKLKKYASLFGLDTTSGIELYESKPNVSDSDSVRSSIGQGTHDYTPIQLSRYVTTIANRGINYNLTLLNKITDKDHNVIIQKTPVIYKDLTYIKDSTWDSIQKGMYMVVNEPKGSVYDIYENLGVTVAGKTGTSQISKVDPNNALFVSYAPYENPQISVTAVIPNGHTSGNAAELAKDIYKLYFGLEDKNEIVEGDAVRPGHNISAFSD